MPRFGEYLKLLREEQRMSLRDVERRTGVSNAYLGQIELGKRPPPHPNILKKLAPLYSVSVYELMVAAGYLDEAQSQMKYKCLNPDCAHDFEVRGAEPLRCPYCGTSYVLDTNTFTEVALAEAKWLADPIPPGNIAAHLAGRSKIISKLFPTCPFGAFRVLDRAAEELKMSLPLKTKERR